MQIDVKFLAGEIRDAMIADATVVVFDVLRATTTITAALSVGITSIRAFADLRQARLAAAKSRVRPLLCGERRSVQVQGFDLGNSPRAFTNQYAGREMILATTNGTRALARCRAAKNLFAGALINARAVAKAAADTGRDVFLICAGTDKHISLEDVIGTGAVANELLKHKGASIISDQARIALRLFQTVKTDLPATLRDSQGGRNIIKAGLEPDIDFCAQLNTTDTVGAVDTDLLIRKL